MTLIDLDPAYNVRLFPTVSPWSPSGWNASQPLPNSPRLLGRATDLAMDLELFDASHDAMFLLGGGST